MNKKIIGLLILCLFILPIISARQQIENTTFTIDIYNNTLEIKSSEYSGNNKNFSLIINNITNADNSTYLAITKQSILYNFLFVRNITVEMDLVDQYSSCLIDMKENISYMNNNITACLLNGQIKDNQISQLNTQITNLTEKAKETDNLKYLFGICGIAIGALGMAFYRGDIKKKGFREKKDEFSLGRNG
jgi:hypothetical protein